MNDDSASIAHRTRPNLVTFSCGVLALAVAAYVLFGATWDLRWLLACGAVGVGVLMLIASARTRPRS